MEVLSGLLRFGLQTEKEISRGVSVTSNVGTDGPVHLFQRIECERQVETC